MDEKKKPPSLPLWLGRTILDQAHVDDLEQRAAIHEFDGKLPRHEAEAKAHEDYVKEQRLRAAAHHLAGLKAAHAVGDMEQARKHGALYELHVKAAGLEAGGAVPPEVKAHEQQIEREKLYRFKPHKADYYALEHKGE